MRICVCLCTHTVGCRKRRKVNSPLLLRIIFRDLAGQAFVHSAFWKRSHLLCIAVEHDLSSLSSKSATLASNVLANSSVSATHHSIWIKLPSFCGPWFSHLRIKIITTVQLRKVIECDHLYQIRNRNGERHNLCLWLIYKVLQAGSWKYPINVENLFFKLSRS